MKDNNRQVRIVGDVVLIEEGAKILLKDAVGRETDSWNRWSSEGSSSESFQNK